MLCSINNGYREILSSMKIPQDIPLLRDILQQQGGELDLPTRPPITLAMLAKELNVIVGRLVPLVEFGWLALVDGQIAASISPSILIQCPSPAAITWLRQFFLPPQAKPIFTIEDVQGLLAEAGVDLPLDDIARLVTDYGIPCQFDPGLGGKSGRGLLLSWQSARKLVLEVLTGGRRQEWNQVRYDRQAMLWFLLQRDPSLASRPPDFQEKLEEEISRIANLPEPQRSIRAATLLEQWEDAKAVANSLTTSPSPSTTSSPLLSPSSASPVETSHTSVPTSPSSLASLERSFFALRKHG